MARRGRRRQSSLRAAAIVSSTTPPQQDNSTRTSDRDETTVVVATTPDELHILATNTLQYRKRGSKNVIKAWLHWRTAAIDAIRCDLSHRLLETETTTSQIVSSSSSTTLGNNDNSCTSSFEDLHYKLGVAADTGLNGDGILFNNAIARCGYAVNFLFSRATNLADLLIDSWNSKKKNQNCGSSSSSSQSNLIIEMLWNDDDDDDDELNILSYTNNDRGSYSVISLGGGPGFDYVGVALASSFVSYYNPALRSNDDDNNIQQQQQQQLTHSSMRRINVTVFDYEVGWQNIVTALSDSTRHILHHSTNHVSCAWGGQCDITKSLYDPINNACQEQLINAKDDSVPTLYICQYCIAENVVSLRASKYIFFHQLFETAIVGTMFILTEVHPRAWPDFFNLINDHCPYMHMGFSKSGRRMILRKMKCTNDAIFYNNDILLDEKMRHDVIMSERDFELIKQFEELGRLHERNLLSGYRRQTKR